MPSFDYAAEEVLVKIVYWGADRSGKTTNLRQIHARASEAAGAELAIVTRSSGRMQVLDLLPEEPGRVRGLRMRLRLFALEGPSSALPARAAGVLRGADGVVFVADSRAEALAANEESLEGLRLELEKRRGDWPPPIVVQYNKRDLATALPLERLGERLNQRALPAVESIALQGIGVEETLRLILRKSHASLVARYGEARDPQFVERRRGGKPAEPAPSEPPPKTERPRVPTERSLAGRSLPPPPGAADRTARIRLTKPEIIEKLREEAETPPRPDKPEAVTPPPAKKD